MMTTKMAATTTRTISTALRLPVVNEKIVRTIHVHVYLCVCVGGGGGGSCTPVYAYMATNSPREALQ